MFFDVHFTVRIMGASASIFEYSTGVGWVEGRCRLTVGDLNSDVLHSSLHGPGPTLFRGGGDPVVRAGNGMVVNHQLGNKKSLSVTPEQGQLQQLLGDTGWYQTVLGQALCLRC